MTNLYKSASERTMSRASVDYLKWPPTLLCWLLNLHAWFLFVAVIKQHDKATSERKAVF